MKHKIILALVCVPLTLALSSPKVFASTEVTKLRCEQVENPLGMDTPQPHLSWQLDSTERGQKQAAYEIFVASSEKSLRNDTGDIWDSGRVESDETVDIAYQGKTLGSRERCFWKVRVWDTDGKPHDSAVAFWEMGLLAPTDWKAQWIGRTTDTNVAIAPLLRREFTLDGKIKQARAYISGLGYFELYLNGKRVGDHLLDPGYTRYDRHVLYVTHDVTDLLKSGHNAAGIILGDGWFNVPNKAAWNFDVAPWRAAPRVICQIEIELTDGRRVVVDTNRRWKTSDSPIIYNTIYSGEIYDARTEQPGWDQPGFDDSNWISALLVDPPKGALVAQIMPPIRTKQTLAPVAIHEARPGVYVFDFGQNLAGHADLAVRGPAGTEVSLRYGERLGPDGSVDQTNIAVHVKRFGANQRFQNDTYILKGQGTERWHSRFSYSGFQYVEVTGFPGTPNRDSLTAVFTHSDVPETGEFQCSNPLLNRIWTIGRWSYLSNLQGIPTDCPHREKNGWTGDAQIAAEQAMYNYFPAAVYNKWLNDFDDDQRPSGEISDIIPSGGWGYGFNPAWDSAYLLIPYYDYVYYGDTENLRRHYEGMKRYVDYLTSRAGADGTLNTGLNDWAPWKTRTGPAITDTAYYYVDAKIVALAARLNGKTDDAQNYETLADHIRAAFNQKFYQPDTGLYDNGSQTALSCALYQGLVPEENRARVLTNLVNAVAAANGHIDTGILGAKYLMNTLLENGRADVAYQIVTQTNQPGWGWWVEQGATTMWEEWNGTESRNHIMFGDVMAWFYKALAGIRPDPAAPGFKHFFVAPQVVGDLTSARGEYNSIRGKIVSDWYVSRGEFHLRLTVPVNTTATLSLPVSEISALRDGVNFATRSRGLSFQRIENGRSLFLVESGDYDLSGPLNSGH